MTTKVFNLNKEQRNYIRIAKELNYKDDTIERILGAKTDAELIKAMRYGREKSIKEAYVCLH